MRRLRAPARHHQKGTISGSPDLCQNGFRSDHSGAWHAYDYLLIGLYAEKF